MSLNFLKSDNNTISGAKFRKKVLVADDSALMRRVLCDIIQKDSRLVVEDVCVDGQEAYEMIKKKMYDVVVLDVVMPRMTGLELLERLQKEGIAVSVVVASTLTKEGAKETLKALELGAVDFVAKPTNYVDAQGDDFTDILLTSVWNAANTDRRKILASNSLPQTRTESNKDTNTTSVRKPATPLRTTTAKPVSAEDAPWKSAKGASKLRTNKPLGPKAAKKIVALACSTGGPKALQSVVPFLPADLDAAVLIVQHMPEGFTAMMAQKLDAISKMHVKEAAEGDIVSKGTVYIAKGGRHMNVVKAGAESKIHFSDEPIREGVRPCANYMYESLINCGYDEVTCVVLTGMGQDGKEGIKHLAAANNIYCISQDEETSVVYGMPKAVYEAELVNEVVPLTDIVGAIVKNVGVK